MWELLVQKVLQECCSHLSLFWIKVAKIKNFEVNKNTKHLYNHELPDCECETCFHFRVRQLRFQFWVKPKNGNCSRFQFWAYQKVETADAFPVWAVSTFGPAQVHLCFVTANQTINWLILEKIFLHFIYDLTCWITECTSCRTEVFKFMHQRILTQHLANY